jgi:hypothetical protein
LQSVEIKREWEVAFEEIVIIFAALSHLLSQININSGVGPNVDD